MPALVASASRASGEDQLRDEEEMDRVRKLREELSGMDHEEAARKLAEQIAQTSSNAELLSRL